MLPPLVSSSGGDIGPCESNRKLLPFEMALSVSAKTITAQIVAQSTNELRSFLMIWDLSTQCDPELRETLVHGMGELHLEIYSQRMKSEFDCEVELGQPKVAYREMLAEPCKFDYFHKKQTGGHGEYGRIIGVMEPLPPDQNMDFEIVDNIIGTGLPRKYIPSIEKGFREQFEKGPLVGQKVVGVRIRLFDGANHSVDSGDIAFINTAKFAAQDVYEDGKWQLMEPVMKLEVCIPRENGSQVIGSLMKRRLVTTDTHDTGVYMYIEGEVPLNDMFGFMTDLRMMTQGKGEYTMEYARYAPVPVSLTNEIIAKVKSEQDLLNNEEEQKKEKETKLTTKRYV